MLVQTLQDKLGLKPHPEGGSYAEFYRSTDILTSHGLPPRFGSDRSAATAIYYLLRSGERSLFHKIKSDELWIHLGGGALNLVEIAETTGRMKEYTVGHDIEHGEVFSCVIPAGHWFAARPQEEVEYSLSVCVVAPGFDFEDFELATRLELLALFPDHAGVIHDFTREP